MNAAAKGTVVPDETLDKRIENRITADASLKKYDIDVSVKNRVATLTGNVATEAERIRAAKLANMKGISRIDNQLVVSAAAPKVPAVVVAIIISARTKSTRRPRPWISPGRTVPASSCRRSHMGLSVTGNRRSVARLA
jgi:hypothetical protein